MIRLLNVHTLCFGEFHEHDAPPYAIASHRWQDDEATFKDVLKCRNQQSKGFAKIRGFCDFIKSMKYLPPVERINWLWIDTCCIDRKSSAELSEAINSMYGWYADAEICIVYLFDVRLDESPSTFESSDWFKRGWTLQELIAPAVVLFTDCIWTTIGHKRGSQADNIGLLQSVVGSFGSPLGPQINERISIRTKINENVLLDHNELEDVSVEVRLSWMNERQTTRIEDEAYCLLGIFDIYMPLIYGERQQARRRLLDEILRRQSAMMNLAKQTRTDRSVSSDLVDKDDESKVSLSRTLASLQHRIAQLEAEQRNFRFQESARRHNKRSIRRWNNMLDQYNQLQQQTMTENLEQQKTQAFWNPLESMSKRDATN